MEERDSVLLTMRTESLGEVNENSSIEETFQNETLRPILKLQNELLLAVFSQYFVQYKNVFYTLNARKKEIYLTNIFQTDQKFLHFLKGLIIGMFTMEEYKVYALHTPALNKRMMTMLQERVRSQISSFELSA